MTLLQCPECGHTVSDAACACPGCGAPPPIGSVARSDTPTPEPHLATVSEPPVATPALGVTPGRNTAAHPWRRCFARHVDVVIVMFVTGLVIYLVAPTALSDPDSERRLSFFALASWSLGEAICLAAFGTTPGKSLLATRVRDAAGARPSFRVAFRRSVGVWWFGCGAYVPFVVIFTMLVARDKLMRAGTTTWDEKAGTRVEHGPLRPTGVVVAALILLVWLVLEVKGGMAELSPSS